MYHLLNAMLIINKKLSCWCDCVWRTV